MNATVRHSRITRSTPRSEIADIDDGRPISQRLAWAFLGLWLFGVWLIVLGLRDVFVAALPYAIAVVRFMRAVVP